MIVQGRNITPEDIESVKHLMREHPDWSFTRLSREICNAWGWRNANAQLKDMACRALLRKLEQRGFITLPARQVSENLLRRHIREIPHERLPVEADLGTLGRVRLSVVDEAGLDLFKHLICKYHYLGYHSVGENIGYMAFDREDNPLACMLFGSPAWKVEARDRFIGWDQATRQANLRFLTNNTRFLILPWVRVPHLASHVLAKVSSRICSDWNAKYGHPVYLLETYVDRSRFRGTSYRAANWTLVGQTKGRSRNDRDFTLKVPVKDIYLYPLTKRFGEALRRKA